MPARAQRPARSAHHHLVGSPERPLLAMAMLLHWLAIGLPLISLLLQEQCFIAARLPISLLGWPFCAGAWRVTISAYKILIFITLISRQNARGSIRALAHDVLILFTPICCLFTRRCTSRSLYIFTMYSPLARFMLIHAPNAAQRRQPTK